MKILIDLDRAVTEGAITAVERDRLRAMSGGQTADLALNILIGFGVVAMTVGLVILSGGLAGLLPPGILLAAAGLWLVLKAGRRWAMLGQIVLVVGAALLGAGLVVMGGGSAGSLLIASAILAGAAVVAENGLLAAGATLVLASVFGASTRYGHARYTLIVEEPTWTIAAFALLAVGLVALAPRLPAAQERLALIAARTAALMVNFAFLVGSLWGDKPGADHIPALAFSVAWALALIGAAIWAWRENRRWPLVAATAFGAIHFYTQFFERIGPHPAAIALAGLSSVAIGYGLKQALAGMPRPA